MQTAIGRQTHALKRLSASASGVDFFQAVRLIDRHLNAKNGDDVFFKTLVARCFSTAAIHSMQVDDTGGDALSVSLSVSFMGLAGQNGVLPQAFTEILLEGVEKKLPALADFLAIFNHRLIRLFYQAWRSSRFFVSYESNPKTAYQKDKLLAFLNAIAGGGLQAPAQELKALSFYYAGLLATQVRTAKGLCAMLSDYFGLDFRLEPFKGQWRPIDRTQQTQLSHHIGSAAHQQLGLGACIGHRAWMAQHHFALHVGPLDYPRFKQWLPSGQWLRELRALVTRYVGPIETYVMNIGVKASTIPAARLGRSFDFRLGWTSFLVSTKKARHDKTMNVEFSAP
jgi:type VI secretion system protein ImpH